jgi:hypothetical protein
MGFQKIATGNNFVIAVLDGGLVSIFGTNTTVKSNYALVEDAVDVFAADDIAFVIRSNGIIVGFGSTRNDRLPVPYDIQNAKSICIGPDYVLCLCSDGTLKHWGTGENMIPNTLMNNKIVSVSNQGFEVTVTLENGQLVQWNLLNQSS